MGKPRRDYSVSVEFPKDPSELTYCICGNISATSGRQKTTPLSRGACVSASGGGSCPDSLIGSGWHSSHMRTNEKWLPEGDCSSRETETVHLDLGDHEDFWKLFIERQCWYSVIKWPSRWSTKVQLYLLHLSGAIHLFFFICGWDIFSSTRDTKAKQSRTSAHESKASFF